MRFIGAESYKRSGRRGPRRAAPDGEHDQPDDRERPDHDSGICQSQLWVTPKAMELLIVCSAMHGYSEPVFQ